MQNKGILRIIFVLFISIYWTIFGYGKKSPLFYIMKRQETEIERMWSFLHVKVNPQQQIDVHQRNTWELSYVMQGRGERILDGNRSPFAEHDLVLIAPNIEHGWIFDPQTTDEDGLIECITLQWTAEFLSHIELMFPAWAEVKERFMSIRQCAVFDAKRSSSIVDRLLLLDHADAVHFPMVLLDLLLDVLDQLPGSEYIERHSKPTLSELRLRQVEIYTSCNYARHISIADVARHVGMNRSSFCTFFSRETGESYMSYLNRYRLKVAHHLLMQRDDTISSICWQCGFNDLGYFDRLFRREFGVSPSEARKA